MRIVLDASAAIAVVLLRSGSAQFSQFLADADLVLAPDLFVAEVVNTIWKYHHFEKLAIDLCDRALSAAIGLVDTLVSAKDLHGEAFLLARTCGRPAYDMFYLALARREDAHFLTADSALRKEARRQGVRTP